MNHFTHGFADELIKEAKKLHPIARVLAAPSVHALGLGGLVGAGTGSLGWGALGALAGGARRGVGQSKNVIGNIDRIRYAGGKGLMKTEIKHMAEGLGVSEKRMLKMIERAGKANKEHEGPIGTLLTWKNRADTTKYNPIAAGARALDTRALSDKIQRGAKLDPFEEELVSMLRKQKYSKGEKALAGAGAIGAGAAGVSRLRSGGDKHGAGKGLDPKDMTMYPSSSSWTSAPEPKTSKPKVAK